jgi:hypothetical protein
MPNGVEYFMGATGSTFSALPPVVNTVGVLTWTWPYDPTTTASYQFQLSDNLAIWTDVAPPDASIAVLSSPTRIQFTLPTVAPRKFCRLVITP